MSRLKFRAWHFDSTLGKPEMLSDDELNALDRKGFIHFYDLINISNKDFILMQYTGLKDKNGVENIRR